MNATGKRTRHPGQSVVELALVMPLVAMLLLGLVDAGYALTTFITVQNGNREGARAALAGATDSDVWGTMQNDYVRLSAVTPATTDVWVVRGATDASGNLPAGNWSVNHVYGSGAATPSLTRDQVRAKLVQGYSGANIRNIKFVYVETRYRHTPFVQSGLTAVNLQLPLLGRTIIRKQ